MKIEKMSYFFHFIIERSILPLNLNKKGKGGKNGKKYYFRNYIIEVEKCCQFQDLNEILECQECGQVLSASMLGKIKDFYPEPVPLENVNN